MSTTELLDKIFMEFIPPWVFLLKWKPPSGLLTNGIRGISFYFID